MPELIEVETYRRLAEGRAVGRLVRNVTADDDLFLKGDTTPLLLEAALLNRRIRRARRIGKLMLLDIGEATLGLRYGMTGRLLVDGHAAIDALEYSSDRDDPAWDRFGLGLSGRRGAVKPGRLVIRDPRRLGGVELNPDESQLGPDAWHITAEQLGGALGSSTVLLKARLLDQARVAGVGNLIADETLWRVGLAPDRPARSLSREDVDLLAAGLRSTIAELDRRGGSHTGDLQESRGGGPCPRDGAELRRDTIGGRTTWWCPVHQR